MRYVHGIDEAEALWRANVPSETIFDLWEVRMAFHRHFRRPLRFISGEAGNGAKVFLPLSWVEEKKAWCFFPGETWADKTWLEQNRLHCGDLDGDGLAALLESDFHLRYVRKPSESQLMLEVDEIGYVFYPEEYGYDIGNWWSGFGRRHAKNLRREMDGLRSLGAVIRPGGMEHFDLMVEMSIAHFGEYSYFADIRFREGFRDMLMFLSQAGMLRVIVVEIRGYTVAVDFAAVFRNRCTLLAGGVDSRFPEAAKFINLHHLQYACAEKYLEADFLCGDFSWKPLFHLSPRPLYLFTSL